MSMKEWNKERDRLQNELIAAALKLQRHLGRVGFMLPIEDKRLLITVAPLSHDYGESEDELESEISADASKLYELKQEKFIDIQIEPDEETDPHLFVTIGPDDSPQDDEPSDDATEERY